MALNKPKILLISSTSYLQKFYHALPQEMVKQSGAELRLLVTPYWKELWAQNRNFLEKSIDAAYEIIQAKVWFPGNLHFSTFRSPLPMLLKDFQPDIIDLENEPFNLGSWQIVHLRNKYSPGSKIVLHASQNKMRNYPFPFNFIEKYTLKSVSAILARNAMAGDILHYKGFRGKIAVISHPANSDAFFPRELPELCRQINPAREIIIGYVGALARHKGISTLLRALQGLPCRLLIVGDGKEKSALEKQARQLHLNTVFTGSATHEEVAQYLNCMDIFVLPSETQANWSEKFGRVLPESMSSGLAVIGSTCGEIPNVIGNCGLIFQEGSVTDLRNKIKLLLNDSKMRSELGWKARKRVIREFSAAVVAEKTIGVYRQLLK